MWQKLQFPSDLVLFTEEIFNGKLHFLCSERGKISFEPNYNLIIWEVFHIVSRIYKVIA